MCVRARALVCKTKHTLHLIVAMHHIYMAQAHAVRALSTSAPYRCSHAGARRPLPRVSLGSGLGLGARRPLPRVRVRVRARARARREASLALSDLVQRDV